MGLRCLILLCIVVNFRAWYWLGLKKNTFHQEKEAWEISISSVNADDHYLALVITVSLAVEIQLGPHPEWLLALEGLSHGLNTRWILDLSAPCPS